MALGGPGKRCAIHVLSLLAIQVAIIDVDVCLKVCLAQFLVKEYLTSSWLAKAWEYISRFCVSRTQPHTMVVTQACL